MTNAATTRNQVRKRRRELGLSQAELAGRAGISRTSITAIEGERLVPSVATALALAQILGCTVEELFGEVTESSAQVEWAWPAPATNCRYWRADIGAKRWLYPVEATNLGEIPHDGAWSGRTCRETEPSDPGQVLVVATCDPAVGLLASEYARQTPFRMLPLTRSSRVALELVRQGKVHAAGVHLASSSGGNASIVRESFGAGLRLLRIGVWQEGIAFAPHRKLRSVQAALRSRLQWVGREPGSGARQCLDELLAGRNPPRRTAPDHRGVALAIRCGWADAGVCLRLTGEEAGLGFLGLRSEAYDLCFSEEFENDRRLRALIEVVRSSRYRQLLDSLPGYAARTTGDLAKC